MLQFLFYIKYFCLIGENSFLCGLNGKYFTGKDPTFNFYYLLSLFYVSYLDICHLLIFFTSVNPQRNDSYITEVLLFGTFFRLLAIFGYITQ